eukprot:ctg_1231.g304
MVISTHLMDERHPPRRARKKQTPSEWPAPPSSGSAAPRPRTLSRSGALRIPNVQFATADGLGTGGHAHHVAEHAQRPHLRRRLKARPARLHIRAAHVQRVNDAGERLSQIGAQALVQRGHLVAAGVILVERDHRGHHRQHAEIVRYHTGADGEVGIERADAAHPDTPPHAQLVQGGHIGAVVDVVRRGVRLVAIDVSVVPLNVDDLLRRRIDMVNDAAVRCLDGAPLKRREQSGLKERRAAQHAQHDERERG